MNNTRQPAVAGSFYPADPQQLREMLEHYLVDAQTENKVPRAIIAPHAGYIYSGPIAASAYARLKPGKSSINRVMLVGPSHRIGFKGLAISSADYFATPLGKIPVDIEAVNNIARLAFVQHLDQAHALEHSLEVHLPFLQQTLDNFSLIPIVAGDASADEVHQVLETVWDKPGTLIVISSDLSHYHRYEEARALDLKTSKLIEQLDYEQLDYESACGRVPVSGLLALARQNSLQIKTIDLRNSGDTAGDKNRVVGYGAYVLV